MPEMIFQYERAPDYRIIMATGVWGSVVPTGMVMFDLITEHVRPPERVHYSVGEGGKLGPETSREPSERTVVRLAQVGVMVTADAAEGIGQWLIQRAQEVRERQSPKENS